MTPHPLASLALLTAFGLTACNKPAENVPDEDGSAQQATLPGEQMRQISRSEPTEIAWEDLMPEGEEERLEQLYTDYYEQLEQQMAASAQAQRGSEGDIQDLVAAIGEGSSNDTMEQVGTFNVVSEFNGKAIRLPGYVVPFDFSAQSEYREFLLVPYFGACLHTPPPPPNQIVFVKADPAATIKDIYEPVWVEGILKTGEFNSDLGDTAYELTLSKLEAYVY